MFDGRRARERIALASALVVTYLFWSIARVGFDDTSRTGLPPNQPLLQMQLPCRSLPGADEVLIIIQSGPAELDKRLVIHLSTSVRQSEDQVI